MDKKQLFYYSHGSYYPYQTRLKMRKKASASLIAATWFKSGLVRPVLFRGMAGTYGSIAALPLCVIAVFLARAVMEAEGNIWLGIFLYADIVCIILTLGLLTVQNTEEELGPMTDWKGKTKKRDQNQIVIDEVLGMLISCIPILFVPDPSMLHFGLALFFFRIFDITKLFPTNLFDKVKNAFGVMADDISAGTWAAVVLQVLIIYVL